jgi:hypothetical protein
LNRAVTPSAQGDDGAELFGNRTPQPLSLTPNGFDALRVYDGNGDDLISSEDAIYAELLLWRDINHNGVSEPVELTSLSASGISSLSLAYRESRRKDRHGNEFRYRAAVTGTGSKFAYDVFLVSLPDQVSSRRPSRQTVRASLITSTRTYSKLPFGDSESCPRGNSRSHLEHRASRAGAKPAGFLRPILTGEPRQLR